MPQIQLFAHLPRFRMESDQVPFPLGTLVKLTWESYDSLTMGAFTDWRPRFEAADPVFLLVEGEVDLPFVQPGTVQGTAMAEMKFPAVRWWDLLPQVLGSTFVSDVHDAIVDVAWASLLLAVPGAAPAWPRSSVTLLMPAEGHTVVLGGEPRTGLRIQGEADQEYVYSADTACRPVSDDDLVRAASLVPVVRRLAEDAALTAVLRQLMAAADAGLGPADRLVLAVSALEGLLLPDVRSGQQDAFALRVTELLGPGLAPVARAAYRARSRAIHDGPEAAGPEIPAAAAEQLLADVLLASAGAPDLPDPTAPRGASPQGRLLPRAAWVSGTVTTGIDLTPPAGHTVSWSPLVGLTYDGAMLATPLGAGLTTLSPAEIVSMEEKDIRRDFIAKFQTLDQPVAGLAVLAETGDGVTLDGDLMTQLLRPRDLTVVGLRIAGFDGFTDPELLGWYVYQGSLRHRRETAFRQTVLMGLGRDDQVALDADALVGAQETWALLAAYDGRGGHLDLERLLGQFRRAHDPFVTEDARLTLLYGVLEGLLGRFRPAKDPVQLEDLVGALTGLDPETAEWFAARGRSLRNEHAHGAWEPSPEERARALPALRAVCAASLRETLAAWDGSSEPGRAVVERLGSRLEADR